MELAFFIHTSCQMYENSGYTYFDYILFSKTVKHILYTKKCIIIKNLAFQSPFKVEMAHHPCQRPPGLL